MSQYKIEKNVPRTSRKGKDSRGTSKYPIYEMEVGDSFVMQSLSRTMVYQTWPMVTGFQFSSQKLPDGNFRVWRIK
jgi:hypothetical protein